MPSELYQSILRITFDPDGAPLMLLDYDADLSGQPILDGQQIVDVESYMRKAGVEAIARGNDNHTFVIPLSYDTGGQRQSIDALFSMIPQVPRTGPKDVLFEVQDGGAYRLKNAAVRSWRGEVDGRFLDRALEITGGEFITELNPPSTEGNEYFRPDGISRYIRVSS